MVLCRFGHLHVRNAAGNLSITKYGLSSGINYQQSWSVSSRAVTDHIPLLGLLSSLRGLLEKEIPQQTWDLVFFFYQTSRESLLISGLVFWGAEVKDFSCLFPHPT